MRGIKLAILGATGAVGSEMLKVLEERKFPVSELRLLADPSCKGMVIRWNGKDHVVEEATPNSFEGIDVTLSAVGDDISKMLIPEAVKRGCIVIDNSSAYRLDPNVPLVVPEINPDDVIYNEGIISNPNCSTIIGLVAVNALHEYGKINRMIVSTYQAVSGAGQQGVAELEKQTKQYLFNEDLEANVFQYQIAYNLIPHIDKFEVNGYTKEEMKMFNEGRKILHDPDIKISCTCVRVPVFRSHSESITLETEKKISVEKAMELLGKAPGVKVVDDIANNQYPMPKDTSGQDLVYVGRIREDVSSENALSLWCCGDQVRKGAATNAVQIAELLIEKGIVG